MPNNLGGWIAVICVCSSFLVLGCSSGSSGSSTSTAPVTPMVSSIAPSAVLAGSAATTVTITGTGFTSSTIIELAGVSEPTTYVSSTQVTAIIPTSQLATAGTESIVASNG